MTLCVVDMAVSNVGSVANMLRRLGLEALVTSDPDALGQADHIILPGVGAFDLGVRHLRETGADRALLDAAARGVAILGVCLGMQLLADASDEGSEAGLGLVPGVARRLPAEVGGVRYPVPHMGWNAVVLDRPCAIGGLAADGARYYFVHSYAVECEDDGDVVGVTHYGRSFTSVVERGNVTGVQFHPEKSHRHGMNLFAAWAGV